MIWDYYIYDIIAHAEAALGFFFAFFAAHTGTCACTSKLTNTHMVHIIYDSYGHIIYDIIAHAEAALGGGGTIGFCFAFFAAHTGTCACKQINKYAHGTHNI